MKCFVPSCRIDFHKRNLCADGLVSKHRFPRDSDRRLKWLDAIPNVGHLDPDTINFETARICSKHFHRDSFVITDNKRELLASAVPSIFVDSVCDTPFYQEFYVISDGKVEIANPSEQLYYQDPLPAVKKQMLKEKSRKRPIRYAGDIDTTTISPEDAKNIALPKLIKKLEQANKTIRALRATNRRCNEKVARLEQIIDNKFQESVAKDATKASAAKPGSTQATAPAVPSGSTVTMDITPVVGGSGTTSAVGKDEFSIHEDDAYDDDIIIEEGDECELEEYGEAL